MKLGAALLLVKLCALLCLAAQANAQEETYVVAGTAYNLDNNQLIYRELYTALDENRQVRVHYVTPEGDRFASKTLTYLGEYFQPEFELKDLRDDEVVSAKFDGPRLVMNHRQGEKNNTGTFYDNARIVIDAGFDAYIQLNWDQLMAGKRIKFDFAYVQRMEAIGLEVKKIKPAESPLYDANYGQDWVYLQMKVANPLKSLLAQPVFLAYNPNGRYLMRYQGRSNLDDYRGLPWDVRIDYEYLN